MKPISLFPSTNELPSNYAHRLAKYYSAQTGQAHKKELGQFFTPFDIANFMASLSNIKKENIKILDPGCGTCILSCSLIEKISEQQKIKTVDLTTYEIDPKLNIHTAAAISYLNDWLLKKGIILKIDHRSVDFINENYLAIDSVSKEKFDIIISNPPYFKISKEDERKNLFKSLANGQLNIYAVFAAISANMLNKNGELIFIVPRSFSSGEYFKTFRKIFFSKIELNHIHLFVSRKDAFSHDKVLQENLILKGNRKDKIDIKKEITVSQSNGVKDINESSSKKFPYKQLINLNSEEKFLYLPNSDKQEKILNFIKSQKHNLNDLGYKVSTGPIVYFRKKEFLQKEKNYDSVPLIWLDNVKKFSIHHPMNGKSKEQFFLNTFKSHSVLLSNSNMILVRRFSSKEDSSRLIAAPHFKKTFFEFDKIGIENKLNYVIKRTGQLTKYESLGICSILNSHIYDEYFKTFNGNTQVSASELKNMPFPDKNLINKIGKKVASQKVLSQERIDLIVSNALMEEINE